MADAVDARDDDESFAMSALLWVMHAAEHIEPRILVIVLFALGAVLLLCCLYQWREHKRLGAREELRVRAAQQYARAIEEYMGALQRLFDHRVNAPGADWRGSEEAELKTAHAVLLERTRGLKARFYKDG